jgi:hypothetical protein
MGKFNGRDDTDNGDKSNGFLVRGIAGCHHQERVADIKRVLGKGVLELEKKEIQV